MCLRNDKTQNYHSLIYDVQMFIHSLNAMLPHISTKYSKRQQELEDKAVFHQMKNDKK